MSTRRDDKGDAKRPLIDTLVHLARRATGVPTEPLARQSVEAAVRDFVLSPSGSRRVLAREVIAEAAAVIVADLVEDVPPASATRKAAAGKTTVPKASATKASATQATGKAAAKKAVARAPRKTSSPRG